MKDEERSRVSHRHILVVDDSPDNRFIFARLLLKADISVRLEMANGGAEAVGCLERMLRAKSLPLAAFLDVRMPLMSGLDLLRWIRARPAFARIPLILLSDHAEPEEITRAAEWGAQAYLQKSMSPILLRNILEYAAGCENRREPLKPIDCSGNLLAE